MGLQSDILKTFFQSAQFQIASRFAKIATLIPRWSNGYDQAMNADEFEAFVRAEFLIYPQYLEKAFSTGDELWLTLYIGEKIKQGHAVDGDFEKAYGQINAVVNEEIDYLKKVAEKDGVGKELSKLDTALNQIQTALSTRAEQKIRILWIADCLYLDIQSFLAADLAVEKLSLQPDLVTTKNPVERYDHISGYLQQNTYDAIFYCPFSYENSAAFTRLLNYRHAISNIFAANKLAREESSAIEAMLEFLTENTDCPVFVHNASGVMRHHGGVKEAIKDLLTRFARIRFSHTINTLLGNYIGELKAGNPSSQISILDEFSIVKKNGLWNSGPYFHHFGQQHPGKLGLMLKNTYLDALLMIKRFHKKKVVICDLDNTLWQGVIGEGAVEHYGDRQNILKSLKQNGILLAINSKNNAGNVSWDGAVLGDNDFACTRINWQTKAENIGEIAEEMNLNTNSFIFVDDRADERSMVSSVFPDIITLDADDPATWRQLELWSTMLKGSSEMDRTQMYKERKSRTNFVASKPKHSTTDLFKQLDLKCQVALSDRKSLPRIHELINRTNQFNTTGRRTSLKEVEFWHQNPDWSIYTARSKDRFGDMGLVGVLLVNNAQEQTTIEIFVLSCRVFGYGIETAILKAVSEDSIGKTISGIITPTSVNQPCQSVFSDHHFRQEGDMWIYDHASPQIINREWLFIEMQSGK